MLFVKAVLFCVVLWIDLLSYTVVSWLIFGLLLTICWLGSDIHFIHCEHFSSISNLASKHCVLVIALNMIVCFIIQVNLVSIC